MCRNLHYQIYLKLLEQYRCIHIKKKKNDKHLRNPKVLRGKTTTKDNSRTHTTVGAKWVDCVVFHSGESSTFAFHYAKYILTKALSLPNPILRT